MARLQRVSAQQRSLRIFSQELFQVRNQIAGQDQFFQLPPRRHVINKLCDQLRDTILSTGMSQCAIKTREVSLRGGALRVGNDRLHRALQRTTITSNI